MHCVQIYKSTNYLWICQSKNFPVIPYYCYMYVRWYIKSNFISLNLYQLPLTIFYVALAQVVICNILYTTIKFYISNTVQYTCIMIPRPVAVTKCRKS